MHTNSSIATIASDKVLELDISTHMGDNQSFQAGDIVYFYLSHSNDAYLLLIYQDAVNNLIQVLPSKAFPKLYYPAADYYLFPDNNTPFRFEIAEPFGKETIWLFAAEKEFPQLAGKILDNGLKKLKTNNIEELAQELQTFISQEKLKFGQAKTSIFTEANIKKPADLDYLK